MAAITSYERPMGMMPLSEAVDRLFQDAFTWPRLFSPAAGGFGFGSNLYETNDSYIMQVPLPGVKVGELQVTAHGNVVTLHGKTEIPVPDGARSVWCGMSSGEFHEEVTVPGEVDADKASADYRDGVLILTLPKSERSKTRMIKITTEHPQ